MKRRGPIDIDEKILRRLSLPKPRENDDKEARGRALIVGGSREMPGAAILAGEAALRAGAGKLRIATVRSVAVHLATRLPEARVYQLAETRNGDIAGSCAARLSELCEETDAVCFGPGMINEEACGRLLRKLLPRMSGVSVVIDANALACLAGDRTILKGLEGRAILTPQAEEMAGILGEEKDFVIGEPERAARRAATEYGAVVALKGRQTYIVSPEERECYRNRAGNVGLATSGSGDVLAGLIAGLAARGADPLTAAVWGVHVHALAGDRLKRRIGPLGFLARELLTEIPCVIASIEEK